VAFIELAERLRPDAPQTIAYFGAQGVALKVISGDSPRTVSAVAARAGVPHAGDAIDERDLPEDPGPLGALLGERTVFGRVTPHQKEFMVKTLQARGHTVAMTGDGVNDVLALKLADIGVAMGSGAPATKAVAELVLLDNDFGTLPGVVAEGRRVTANIERVANLFITKTVWATLLAVAAGAALLPYPFLPATSRSSTPWPSEFPPSSSHSRRTAAATCPGSSAGCCGSPSRPGSSSPRRRSRHMPSRGPAASP
jgi:cation-transporting ATPase E